MSFWCPGEETRLSSEQGRRPLWLHQRPQHRGQAAQVQRGPGRHGRQVSGDVLWCIRNGYLVNICTMCQCAMISIIMIVSRSSLEIRKLYRQIQRQVHCGPGNQVSTSAAFLLWTNNKLLFIKWPLLLFPSVRWKMIIIVDINSFIVKILEIMCDTFLL